jgi:hypothetical protein
VPWSHRDIKALSLRLLLLLLLLLLLSTGVRSEQQAHTGKTIHHRCHSQGYCVSVFQLSDEPCAPLPVSAGAVNASIVVIRAAN